MIVCEYKVHDPLVVLSDLLVGTTVSNKPMFMYAKKGEEGLLEDYLIRQGYLYYEPVEVEVEDNFSKLTILIITDIKDVSTGTSIVVNRKPPLEPSEN